VKPVARDEIIDYQTYGDRRDEVRAGILEVKAPRRIHLGEHLTFLFENRDTVRYQVQEMMRTEQMVREEAIRHELDTYNELLGGPGELGCTLLVEVAEPEARARYLAAWVDLPQRLYAKLPDGTRVPATFDARQVDEGKLSSVQFLKFDCRGQAPVALGCDLDGLTGEVTLTEAQRQALSADLADD